MSNLNNNRAGAAPLITLDCIDEMIELSNAGYTEDWQEGDAPMVPLTRERVLATLMLNNPVRFPDRDAEDVVREINEEIISKIAEVTSVDPWFDLTRASLTRMMGKRSGPRGFHMLDDIAAGRSFMGDGTDGLSLKEKFYCAQFREWLMKGLPKVRMPDLSDPADRAAIVRRMRENRDKAA